MNYMNWSVINEHNAKKYIYNGTWTDFLNYLKSDGKSFINILKSETSPFYLELGDITLNTLNKKIFEMVIIPTNSLSYKQDKSAFQQYINKSTEDVTMFPNLSGDTLLYIPTGKYPNVNYANLYTFVQTSDIEQIKSAFSKLAVFLSNEDGLVGSYFGTNQKIWISTHGNGVSWLHVRICKEPKYYVYEFK